MYVSATYKPEDGSSESVTVSIRTKKPMNHVTLIRLVANALSDTVLMNGEVEVD